MRPAVPRNFALRVEAAVARDAAARRKRRGLAVGAMSLAMAAAIMMVLRGAGPTHVPVDDPPVARAGWRTTLEGRETVRTPWVRIVGLDAHTLAFITVTDTAAGTETATETETETATETETETATETVSPKELPMFLPKAAIALAVTAGTVLTVHVVRGRAAVHTDDDRPGLVLAAGDRAAVPVAGAPTVTRGHETTAVARTAPPVRPQAAAAQPATDEVAAGECEPTAPEGECDCADGNCDAHQAPELPARVDLSLDGAPIMGPSNAKVTIVELVDFQCPFCEKAVATIHDLAALYPDDVRVAIKHMPLPGHKQARPAAIAAMAADRQGQFWEMHEMLFSNQDRLDAASIVEHARHLKLDLARFQADLADPAIAARVDADFAEAERKGFRGVPSFTINGRPVIGALPLEELRKVVDEELARLKP